MKKQLKCYIYTRVSTSMQVEGYSLDAQKDKLKKYADYQEMVIAGEYSDEGKSGKSIEGRPEFQQMLRDIETGKDNVEFVLVFKLSRFGRNAADVLNSLQRMQDFGVNLICVEDGIDSSKDAGKLMISVLSAVAEIERENILVQTMEGRRQKAREGKWNGGFAPYGYKLVDGELQIAEDEAPIIRLIYDKFINTTMGIGAIAVFLNQNGYRKKIRQNNTMETFSSSFIKGVLDNPIYCGKLAFGRRKNEKIAGTRNEYHVVKQNSYLISEGIHNEIISEEDWNLAQKKRQETGVGNEKVHSLEHEHILSGIVKCPICGSGMYGNVNRKKRKDGTLYKDYFYYACKHRTFIDGHHCTFKKQWNEDKINDAVAEVIGKLVNNTKFENEIRKKIGNSLDTKDMEKEHTNLKEQLKQLQGAKNKLAIQMDHLSVSDKHYDKKYQDMQERMDGLYDEMDAMELSIEEVENRLFNIKQQKISGDNVYQFLLYFDKLYDKMTDGEKKEFVKSFVEVVHLYEKEQEDGRFLKRIKFKFPVFFNGTETQELDWDNESTVEPNVPMDKLVKETLKYGLVPPVVMEFPGITVGGGIQGAAAESGSFKWGCFSQTFNWFEMVLANGEIVKASGENNKDLFYGTAGSYGSLGIISSAEIKLISACKYVKLVYIPVDSFNSARIIIEDCVLKNYDYVDGIMFSKNSGIVMAGKLSDTITGQKQRFFRSFDPWFYLHAEKILQKGKRITETIPINDYLFRYDRGAFWVGKYAFDLFGVSFNAFNRWLLNPILHTRKLYQALQDSGASQKHLVQDMAVPVLKTVDFIEFIDKTLNIYPLWLCPMKPDKNSTLQPNCIDTSLAMNVGIWGTEIESYEEFVNLNRSLEKELKILGGKKCFYAQSFYTEKEFWDIYDKPKYEELRQKYHAENLPSVFEKTKVKKVYSVNIKRGLLRTIFGKAKLRIKD